MTPNTTEACLGQAGQGIDLLRFSFVRSVILRRWFPYLFQGAMLAAFVALIFLSWGQLAPAGVAPKLFAKSHLVTLLVWGLWWPAMVWAAVLLGRVWCAVCPLELVSNISERLGRRLGIRSRPVRRWMASGAIVVGLYALLQMLVAGEHLNRVPAYTALFLVGLLTLPVLTGLFLKDRAFCRAFCPVGMLLAIYGRGGMLAIRSRGPEACASCTVKGCRLAANRARADARSCPSLLDPPRLKASGDCLLCGQCLKACELDNMTLVLRRPFHAVDDRRPLASWPATLFVMLVSGFVTWELAAEWKPAEEVFLAVPAWLSGSMGLPRLAGYLNGAWALAVVPLILWLGAAFLAGAFGKTDSIGQTWRRIALPVAVVVAAGHMVKGLAKFVSWAPFLPYAVREPAGTGTTALFSAGTPTPDPLLGPIAVLAVGIILVAVAVVLAIREANLAGAPRKGKVTEEGANWSVAQPRAMIPSPFQFGTETVESNP